MPEIPFVDRARSAVNRFRVWAGLSVSALVALAAGIVALAGTIVVFGGVTEDVTRHNGLSSSDPAHLRWFIDHRPDAMVSAARVATTIGSPLALALVAIVAAVVLWQCGQRLLLALAPGIALALAGLAAAAGKVIVGRGRPPVPLHLIAESDPSFPSGHATDTTAVYLTLALIVAVFMMRGVVMRAAVVGAAGLLSLAVGASRLVLGVHWPSDVIAGLALGAATALIVTIVASLASRVVPNRPATTGPIARFVHVLTLRRQASRFAAGAT
jgi:undecaprenyl-diphosphatase